MKRNDIVILVLLFGLLLSWRYIDSKVIKKHFYKESPVPAASETAPPADPGSVATVASSEPAAPELAAATEPRPETAVEETPSSPEEVVTLENERIAVTFSSQGATIKSVILKRYRSTLDPASGPVELDFASAPALAYENLPGFGDRQAFSMSADRASGTVRFERLNAQGVRLVRTVSLGANYSLSVTDTLLNESDAPVTFSAYRLRTGPMRREPGHRDSLGFVSLGVDTLSPGGEGVKHWGSKLTDLFKEEQKEKSLPRLPVQISRPPHEAPVDWVAAKNKYFVQILTPEDGGEGAILHAVREVPDRERSNPQAASKMTPIEEVAVSLVSAPATIGARQGLPPRKLDFYVGPMKLDELQALSLHRVDVMELGMWRAIGKILLATMNFIHDHLWPHNYGLAIILLTLIVRTVFWPITHKSTESMKKMAEVQPLVTQIREKFKDNPQRMQQEIMNLYKERKINPLGGCLPMLIQIPIFIALFMVLRSAIELRFASFLWIKDLSEPENLFVDVIGFPVNLLPIFMALTMYIQQRMTPTAGDPAQAKMMRVMMPGMMLFFLYNYAAGLALYWTTQNLLMIFQQFLMQRKKKPAAA